MSKVKIVPPLTECRCKLCGKKPSELSEYVILAEEEGFDSPEAAMKSEEGTFNFLTGQFYCTSCYIKAGCPSGKA